jgi:hypothetical protein
MFVTYVKVLFLHLSGEGRKLQDAQDLKCVNPTDQSTLLPICYACLFDDYFRVLSLTLSFSCSCVAWFAVKV